MKKLIVDELLLKRFAQQLREDEKSSSTVEKYMRDARRFAAYAGKREADRTLVLSYKEELGRDYPPKSANSMLAALNSLVRFAGRDDLRVRQFRMQQEAFRPESEELTRDEYVTLVDAAEHGCDEQTSLLLQTICCTGIRVSELGYITVEAAKKGEASVCCKCKTRRIFIVSALREKLLRYAEKNGITEGPVFLTSNGRPIDRMTSSMRR